MKRAILILLAAVSIISAKAQQIPLFTQYYNNEFLYNPSQVLTDDYSSLSMFYRKQWISSDDPLTTQGIVFQTPLQLEKIGLGVTVINDNYGIFNRTGGSMAYSYRVDLNDQHKLLLGLSAGYLNTNYDWNQDISLLSDPRFMEAITDRITSFDATFGLTYAWNGLEVGMAIPHLLANDLDFTTGGVEPLYFNYRHYVGSASYLIEFEKFSLKPLLLARYQPSVAPLLDASVVFNYDRKAWAAVGYRYEGAMTFGAGVNLHDRLNIGYSYDLNMNSDLNTYFGATHEINLTIRFGRTEPGDMPERTKVKDEDTSMTLEKLQLQINKLKKENKEQQETLDDHEKRITDLENQVLRDSLQKTMEEILDEMTIGSGSVDYRGNQVTLTEGARKIVNPGDPKGLFGYKEDGTAITPFEKYDGPVFYDKEATKRVSDPKNPNVELYDEDGNLIDDINSYTGRVKTKDGKYVKDDKGNMIYYDNSSNNNGPGGGNNGGGNNGNNNGGGNNNNNGGRNNGTGGNNGGGNNGGTNNGTGNNGSASSGSSTDIPNYGKPELAKDGIRYTAPGNYVVVGSFRNKDYAIKMREELQDKGYSAGIVYNHFRKWFYVYSFENKDFNQTLDELRKEQIGAHKDAWVHVIIE